MLRPRFALVRRSGRRHGLGIFELTACGCGAEGDLGHFIVADLEIRRLDQIKIVAAPQVGLDDPLFKMVWQPAKALIPYGPELGRMDQAVGRGGEGEHAIDRGLP
jgi:hypothetical protein